MVLLLDQLRTAERAFDLSRQLPDLKNDDARPLAPGPLRLQGVAGPGPTGIELHARLEGRLELCCSRCLERFSWELSVPVDLLLVDAVESGGPDVELRAEDAEVFYAEGGRADLEALLREQIHLNLPLKPVCTPDCRGLCPACGGNRNSIECGCRSTEIDPRLAPLERLRPRKDERRRGE
jgi:uncharacterized protein